MSESSKFPPCTKTIRHENKKCNINDVALTLMAVWCHCWQISQVGVHAVRQVSTRLGVCMAEQMCVCASADVIYRLAMRKLLSCQNCGCLGVSECVFRLIQQDGPSKNRKQTSSSSGQSPWGFWFGYSNQSGNSLSSTGTNLSERTKRTMSLLFFRKILSDLTDVTVH